MNFGNIGAINNCAKVLDDAKRNIPLTCLFPRPNAAKAASSCAMISCAYGRNSYHSNDEFTLRVEQLNKSAASLRQFSSG
jgi:hypothetical protein